MHAAKADGAWAPAAARADLALAKSLGASALCTDAFLADDANEGAKLQTFVQAAKPVKVIIGRRAFDDVLEKTAHGRATRCLERLGAAGVSTVIRESTGDAWTGRKTLKELLLIAQHVPVSPHHCEWWCGFDRVRLAATPVTHLLWTMRTARAGTHRRDRGQPGGGRPPMPAPGAPGARAGRVGRGGFGVAPRPPATPAAAAALVQKLRLCPSPAWHAGTNDPDADHEKGDIAGRFGGPRRRRPRRHRRDRSESHPRDPGPNPPDVPQGREELRPAGAHGPRKRRGLRGSSLSGPREHTRGRRRAPILPVYGRPVKK